MGEEPRFADVGAAIDSMRVRVEGLTSSALLGEIGQYVAVFEGFELYVSSRTFDAGSLIPWMILGIGNLATYGTLALACCCFLIPAAEWRRVAGSLTADDIPTPVSPSRLAAISGSISFLLPLEPPLAPLWVPFFPASVQRSEPSSAGPSGDWEPGSPWRKASS